MIKLIFRSSATLIFLLAGAGLAYADVAAPVARPSQPAAVAAPATATAATQSAASPAVGVATPSTIVTPIKPAIATAAVNPAPVVAVQPAPASKSEVDVPTDANKVASLAPAPVNKTVPGVKSFKFNSKLMKGSVVRSSGDGTETVLISKRFPNRIATPFAKPRVIDNNNQRVKVHTDGSSIFISSTDDDPFVIFVTGSANTDPVVSLTLIPKDIPAQVVSLQLDSSNSTPRNTAKVEGYTQQVVDLMRTVAVGKAPNGYSEGLMPNVVARQEKDGLVIIPVVRYSGANLDIYKYRVENSKKDIELSETSFYKKGVRAVAIHPNVLVRRGASTNVYVLADKTILDGADDVR